MNKTVIRNFAIWARNKLIADISYHAGLLGISKNGITNALPQSTKDVEFYDIGTTEPYSIRGDEILQRKSLADTIRAKEKDSNFETAYNSVIEEVAYTWFNRLIAVRFMEVNDYLPEHVRVLSSESGKQEPDIVTTPFDAALYYAEGEQQQIVQMKNDNKLDEVFRILFIKQCRELSRILPRLFEGTNDYTELLLSLSFIDQEGVVYHLVHDIPEDDFNVEKGGQVEIIGWLYQYYNSELKDETFALLKNNVKVTKERIPSATQLFTPDWIVRYMVENSLGRLWVEEHPNDVLKSGWKYYVDEAEQEASVKEELEKIRSEYAKLNPEDIKIIDPCMGSGHILVYAFDVLMQIYESTGYSQRDAANSILENNLFGLDIDDRAAQLAYFAVMMKARQYNRRILDGQTDCNVYAIKESNSFDRKSLIKIGDDLRPVAERLLDAFIDAKEYGSIINVNVTLDELDALDKRLDDVDRMSDYGNLLDIMYAGVLCTDLYSFIRLACVMIQGYNAVITNPPYRGIGDVDAKLQDYVIEHFPDSKGDLSTVCMEKFMTMCKSNGLMSMINIPVWMSLASYENLRSNVILNNQIVSLLHLGRGIFGSDYGTVAFVFKKTNVYGYKGAIYRLFEKQGAVETVEKKEERFFNNPKIYFTKQDYYNEVPGKVIAYWANKSYVDLFKRHRCLSDYAVIFEGLKTRDKDRFLRAWFEVISSKWRPYSKGGTFRRWYGNNEYVVNWGENGDEVRSFKKSSGANFKYYFRPTITYNAMTMSPFTGRYIDDQIFGGGGGGITDTPYIYYFLAYVNSVVFHMFISAKKSTVNFEVGQIGEQPIVIDNKDKVDMLSKNNVMISKEDWDSFETSWDFKRHPLV